MMPFRYDAIQKNIIMRGINSSISSLNLVKFNAWYRLKFMIGELFTENINPREIELVSYTEQNKPVVRREIVYQICICDWDNDCVLKDDINGVHIISGAFTSDNEYDENLINFLPNHPMNTIKQIRYKGKILEGNTIELQLLVDLYYSKFRYI